MSITIGSVPYLNARPLIRWFDTTEGRDSGIVVVEDTPARLAQMLERDEISLALVSSFAALEHPDYEIVPGLSISGQGEIKSVRAFSKIPFAMIQSVAMDTSSLTSVALLRILLAEVYHTYPNCLSAPPDLKSMLAMADAALLIGDNGMLAEDRELRVLDLGEAWRRHTGLPFTYAVWLGKPGGVTPHLTMALQYARDWGLTQVDAIAKEESQRLGCTYTVCYEYVTDIMDYGLDDQHLKALETFGEKARALGLLARPRAHELETPSNAPHS